MTQCIIQRPGTSHPGAAFTPRVRAALDRAELCGTKPTAHSSARCKTNPIEANAKPRFRLNNTEMSRFRHARRCKTNPSRCPARTRAGARTNPTAHSSARRLAFLLIAVLALAAQSHAAPSTRPNIVLVISDDQRYDCLGAAGNPNIVTPAQDRLAKEGTLYRQATIHVPQCSPSRATLLTGLAPHQHGWYSNQAAESKRTESGSFSKLPMLPALLKDAGYQTVFVGKWHLQLEPWDAGFADVRTWLPGGGGPYEDANLAHGNSRKRTTQKGFINQIFGDDAVAFLNSDNAKKQPFFLWLALTAPHMPIQPNPADIQKLYAGKSRTELAPPTFPKEKAELGDWQHYYEACTMADRQLASVLDALDRAKLADNTVVIYLGDNGFMMGGRDMSAYGKGKRPFMGKVFPFEDSVRVPIIVRAPGAKAGPSDAPMSSLDLPPTILSYAGLTPPAKWAGRDLHHADEIKESVCEFADNESDKFGDVAYRLVRTPDAKLIVWESKGRKDELYDLKNDPRETKDLIDDPAAAEMKADLLSRLKKWMAATEDPALKWPHISSDTKGSAQ